MNIEYHTPLSNIVLVKEKHIHIGIGTTRLLVVPYIGDNKGNKTLPNFIGTY